MAVKLRLKEVIKEKKMHQCKSSAKSGLPNRVYLSKEAREVVKTYAEQKKKEKKDILVKELTDILSKIK